MTGTAAQPSSVFIRTVISSVQFLSLSFSRARPSNSFSFRVFFLFKQSSQCSSHFSFFFSFFLSAHSFFSPLSNHRPVVAFSFPLQVFSLSFLFSHLSPNVYFSSLLFFFFNIYFIDPVFFFLSMFLHYFSFLSLSFDLSFSSFILSFAYILLFLFSILHCPPLSNLPDPWTFFFISSLSLLSSVFFFFLPFFLSFRHFPSIFHYLSLSTPFSFSFYYFFFFFFSPMAPCFFDSSFPVSIFLFSFPVSIFFPFISTFFFLFCEQPNFNSPPPFSVLVSNCSLSFSLLSHPLFYSSSLLPSHLPFFVKILFFYHLLRFASFSSKFSCTQFQFCPISMSAPATRHLTDDSVSLHPLSLNVFLLFFFVVSSVFSLMDSLPVFLKISIALGIRLVLN
ncbi:unnamed protein product [Acanthosepion pharaonis]|uniref:Uncharacterized protein n=1 Tax=Acanthosepion pharaonis TaxID=158019 RepID=A0A812BKC5_ACAPH|nr:unnamed protein product [Sepia pharaonis]